MRKLHSDGLRIEFYDKSEITQKPKFTHNLIQKKKSFPFIGLRVIMEYMLKINKFKSINY